MAHILLQELNLGVLKNIEGVIARSEATWLSRWHSTDEIASPSLAMTRKGLFQQTQLTYNAALGAVREIISAIGKSHNLPHLAIQPVRGRGSGKCWYLTVSQ